MAYLVCLVHDNASRNLTPNFHQLRHMGILDGLFGKLGMTYFPNAVNESHVLSEDEDWNGVYCLIRRW